MNVIEEILIEKNNLLFEKRTDIWDKSEGWIKTIENNTESIEKNLLLAQIYYLRLMSRLEYEDAEKACDFFKKIPFDYYSEELIVNYISCLKLCYKFEEVICLLKKLLEKPLCFRLKCWCMTELIDDSMVADGVMTKDEYYEFKEKLKELLTNECITIDRIIP